MFSLGEKKEDAQNALSRLNQIILRSWFFCQTKTDNVAYICNARRAVGIRLERRLSEFFRTFCLPRAGGKQKLINILTAVPVISVSSDFCGIFNWAWGHNINIAKFPENTMARVAFH